MAFTRHYCPKFDFVLTECTGKIDDQTLLIHLMSFSSETKKFHFIKELVDMRHLRDSNEVTANGLTRLAGMHPNLFPKIKMHSAVLVDACENKNNVEIFVQLFNAPNVKIKVFNKGFAEPLSWLGYHEADIPIIKRFINNTSKSKRQIEA